MCNKRLVQSYRHLCTPCWLGLFNGDKTIRNNEGKKREKADEVVLAILLVDHMYKTEEVVDKRLGQVEL